MKASKRMEPGEARHRGLDYGRTKWRPRFSLCPCEPCRKERERWNVEGREPHEYDADSFDGCAYVNLEKAFAEAWEKENQPRPGINHGMGILQDLMVRQSERGSLWRGRVAFWVTKRERVIVATAIQWLGSNVGRGWLEAVLGRAGFLIVPKAQWSHLCSNQVKPGCVEVPLEELKRFEGASSPVYFPRSEEPAELRRFVGLAPS